jgi:hypothetical protein
MSVLLQITYGNMALIFLSHFHGYNKNEIFAGYWDIGIGRMFLNVATFNATSRSILQKLRLIFFKTFLPDILMTT